MKKKIRLIIMAVVYTLVAAFFGGLIEKFEPGGNLPTVFAVTVMGAFLLYALLPNEKDSTGKKDAQDSEKTGNPKDGKNDKPQT